jgi:hypothetical protein
MDTTYKYSEDSCNVRKVNVFGNIINILHIYKLPKNFLKKEVDL